MKKNGSVCVRVLLIIFLGVLSTLNISNANEESVPTAYWSEGVFQHMAHEYGDLAAQRVRSLHKLAMDNRQKTIFEKLNLVNMTLNQIPWVSDERNWSAEAYWATPMETLAKFGGDCEDIAIAKFMMLRLMGIPAKNLQLAYVQIKNTQEAHMVLVYMEQGRVALVLDNMTQRVLPHTQRDDLRAVYLVNKEGVISLIAEHGKQRSVSNVVNHNKVKKLDVIREKMERNLESYRQLNNGIPLID